MIVTYSNSLPLGSILSKGLSLKWRFAKPAPHVVAVADGERSHEPCSCSDLGEQETGCRSNSVEGQCYSCDARGRILDECTEPLGVSRKQEISVDGKTIDGRHSLR